MSCQKPALLPILSVVRKAMNFIQIFVPIILIAAGIIGFIQLMQNPDAKEGTKKILNRFLAAVIVFMIPVLINAFMNLLGEGTSFSSCWKDASEFKVTSGGYSEIDESKDRQKIVREY